MIRIKKTVCCPKSLLSKKKYDGEDVKKQILDDQNNKCYMCERILTTDFEIEHLRSKNNYPDLICDWNNLLISCKYCNDKKSDLFDEIPNPITNNIEEEIEQQLDFTNRKALFTSNKNSPEICKCIALLKRIYNGSGRLRKIKEERFFNEISDTLSHFCELVKDYIESPTIENKKKIEEELSISSESLGFKYWIIKDNPNLYSEFKTFLNWNR